MKEKKARKIKIKIIDEGRRIPLPSIPFCIVRFVWKIVKVFHKDKSFLKQIDINEILKEFDKCAPFILVDIDVKKEKTKVYIEVK